MTAQTCGISIAHGTDETVCVITYFLQVFLLTSWCLTSGYDKMKMKRKDEGVKSMKIVCFLLKLVLKILLLPVAFLLRFLCFIWNLLMQLSLWVLSPVMLFVLGCGIYSVVRASWTDVFLLTLIEMGLFAAAVGAGGIMELMERLCECVEDVLTI